MTTEQKPTAIVKADSYAIAKADANFSDLLADNCGPGGLDQFDLERLTVPAGGGSAWEVTTLEGTESQKEVAGVLLGMRDGRVYWSSSIDDSGGGSPPDCVSEDGTNGVGVPGGACAKCGHSQFGSAGRGQACKQQRLLLLVRPEDRIPIIVQLPPTSIKACRQFMTRLVQHGVSRFGAVVGIGLEKEKNADGIVYSKATFRLAARLGDEDTARMRKIGKELEAAFASVGMAVPMSEESEKTND